MRDAKHNLQLQRKRKYFLGRSLDLGLVTHYYRSFGNVERVLDIGCGLGCMGRLKPGPAIKVYGLDIGEEGIAKAKEYEITQVWVMGYQRKRVVEECGIERFTERVKTLLEGII